MNIHQALKEKNRIAGKLKQLDSRILSNGRWIKGNKPDYDLKELIKDRTRVETELIDLKTKITAATAPAVREILQIGELKSFVLTLKSLKVGSGIDRSAYARNEAMEYESSMTEKEKDTLIEEHEKKIGELQDKLDKFNANTEIA